eukprot:1257166-Rhodomonas_salina.1
MGVVPSEVVSRSSTRHVTSCCRGRPYTYTAPDTYAVSGGSAHAFPSTAHAFPGNAYTRFPQHAQAGADNAQNTRACTKAPRQQGGRAHLQRNVGH